VSGLKDKQKVNEKIDSLLPKGNSSAQENPALAIAFYEEAERLLRHEISIK
jgi:hypothetical protein